MKSYETLTRSERENEYAALSEQFAKIKSQGLKLNMARGKPGKDQLDLVSGILTVLKTPDDCFDEGIDVRNYGELMGIPSARCYFAELLGVRAEQTFIGGCASLQLMYDTIAKAYTNGLLYSPAPWSKLERVKFLCPAPGYDRHFKISESMGMEMLTIPMTETGPDMDMVEKLIADPEVKGMWCVPKYSNPDGIIYSKETIARIAAMKPAAPDFLLIWDNAYCVHEFDGEFLPFEDILSLCEKAGNPDMVFEFASTSKITFPGGGISVMAASEANLAYMKKLLTVQVISYDKVNQLRHVRFLKDKAHTLEVMKLHASVLQPKFKIVLDTLEREIAALGIAKWSKPTGGYFVSLNAMDGTAKRALALCAQAGVIMTGAGATYPYGVDPHDSNIRIAPSYPPLDELQLAMDAFCVCLRMAALEKLGEA